MKRYFGFIQNGTLTKICPLSEGEYRNIMEASKILAQWSIDQHLYRIILSNYSAYVELMQSLHEDYVNDPDITWPRADAMVLEINRHILNYLSSIRTFLDHSAHYLKSRYGAGSTRLSRFTTACSTEYDNHFGYRFLYKLRNYAQHSGMPVQLVTTNAKVVSRKTMEVNHTLSAICERDTLLSSKETWNAQLREEIKNLPEQFDITPLIHTMSRCIERINIVVIADEVPNLVKSAQLLHELTRSHLAEGRIPFVYTLDNIDSAGTGSLPIENLPLHLVEAVMQAYAPK